MKKLFLLFILLSLGLVTFAQTKIQLRSTDKAECVKSDYTSLKASFSFSGLEAYDLQNDRGLFSTITMPNTVIGGSEGDPQIPVLNELIAVPFGATPRIEIKSFTSTDYRLEDYGIHTLMPRQPDLFKNQDPKDVPFVYNEAAYQKRGLSNEPVSRVSVNGIMRGVQVGQISIEPVSYDPVNNILRVFNNLEVEVFFDGADVRTTEDMLVKTYSPYFDVLYKQLFNGRAVLDLYVDHPDLWKAPVRMLVIANRMFENCIQDWVAWKTMKGIYVDVNYTDNIGTTADAIKSFIQGKYTENAPTFLIIMGDQDQVAPSVTSASNTSRVSDLYYSSVDGDEFVDMFHSRFSATTTAEMTAILNKGMEYEQYTMPDPSYLSNVLLIAGEDDGWGVTVGRPTIWYATNYYYNTEHGYNNVYEFSHGTYTNCYAPLSSGVGFANYTAHGSQTSWAGPSFSVSDVANLTNEHKYFLAIGNCCQSGDWGYSTCFGEALTRAENKGAYAYIGSCPNTTWKNDYYFGVGATNRADGTMPTYEETGLGIYDAIWLDDTYNTVNSILYVGLLAGNAASALGYELHSATLYYWQAYHVLGDGSIMPYRVQPTANTVSHMAIFPIGMPIYEVSADPGSYVAISKDGVLHGAALVDETGTVQVPITPVTSSGDVTICVTAPNRIPYIATVPAAALEGPYISMDSYTPNATHVGDETELTITFKNVGTDATTGTTTVTLSTDDDNVRVITPTKSFGTLAPEATTAVSGFKFCINDGVADGSKVILHYSAVNGSDSYEGNIVITANEAVLAYQGMTWDGGFTPGETLTVSATFKNTGHYQATNAVIELSSNSDYITINTQPVAAGTLEVGQEVTYDFSITIANNCPETAQLPVTFTMTADGGLSAQGNESLKNSCNVIFNLTDSYGDGWNGNTLTVSFDDGTEDQVLTINSGNSATYTLEIGNGVHVTLTWSTGSYAYECSFNVQYEGDLTIYQSNGTLSAGVLYEFDCNCAAASQTFNITAVSANTNYGTVTGGGEYNYGQTCTVTATPAEGYMFTSWTQNGEVVSTSLQYTFIVYSDMNLVANFTEGMGIMIGVNGESTNDNLPSNSYYNYTLSEQIYTSDELGGAGLITSIAFYNGGSTKTRTYDFYMKATEKTSFSNNSDWVTVSTGDKVFSGSVTMIANDWTVINLTSPFIYDGTSNVVLVTDDNTGSYSSGMACRVFDASNQALYARNDNTNYNPSSPSSYSATVLSVKNQLILTKESMPTGSINITVSANPSTGGSVSGGGEYAFGQTCTVTATPNADYIFTGWTENGSVISSDLQYSFSAVNDRNLVATFIQATVIGESTGNSAYLPSYNYYNYTLSQQIYTASELGAAGTITAIAFYNEGATKTRTYDLYLKATSQSTFSGDTDWVTVTAADKVFSGNVTMTANTWTFIIFDTPFGYDGSSNVVLVTDDNSGTYTSSPHMTCRTYDAASQAIYVYSDNTNFDPLSAPTTYSSGQSHAMVSVKNQIMISKESGNPGTEHQITATASPSEGGTVTGGGTFIYGESCTLTATANTGYTFTKWTKNGAQVSTSANYTFTVIEDADYVAVFTLNSYQVVATAEPAEGGTIIGAGSYNHGTTATLTATAADDYLFEAWKENGNVISTDNTITFTVEANRTLVAHFSPIIQQSQTFTIGWGWVSFYINLSLEMLEDAFDGNGFLIKSKNQFVQYENGSWTGNLTDIEVEKMYQINATGAGTLAMDATEVHPAEHPITVSNGWNWIGYPSSIEANVSTAFSTFESSNEDVLKSHETMTTYIEGYGWWGTLNKMTPGIGYMYNSKATDDKTLVYTPDAKDIEMHTANNDNLHWTVDGSAYRDNANVIATIDAKDLTLSESLEVGAFVNGECRGTTRLLYVEPLDQYLAFLTVYGNDNEAIQFKVYDGSQTYAMDEQITYKNHLVSGSATTPVVLHQSSDEALLLYPNPVKAGETIRLELPTSINEGTIEIIDMMGRIISNHEDATHCVSTPNTPGVYTVRVTNEQGNVWFEKLIVK